MYKPLPRSFLTLLGLVMLCFSALASDSEFVNCLGPFEEKSAEERLIMGRTACAWKDAYRKTEVFRPYHFLSRVQPVPTEVTDTEAKLIGNCILKNLQSLNFQVTRLTIFQQCANAANQKKGALIAKELELSYNKTRRYLLDDYQQKNYEKGTLKGSPSIKTESFEIDIRGRLYDCLSMTIDKFRSIDCQ